MTTNDMHTTTADNDDCLFCHEHLEEAAMRTLEPDIQQRMECHLVRCRMCREELAQIEETLQLLAYSVDQVDPPVTAKSNLMARFEAERDEPSASTEVLAPAPAKAPPSPKAPPRTWRQLPWTYGGLFAGLCVALLVIGAWNFLPFTQSDGDIPRGQIQVMAMENTCPDCHDETGGQIGADPTQKDGLVVAWNLDPQRKHEVWCVNRDGKHTKVSDLEVADTGSVMQTISFPDEVGGYHKIYVIRDDGAEELTVAPAGKPDDDDATPDSSTSAE